MSALQLTIAPAAQADLKNIYHYGLQQWGQTQSESYLEALKEHIWQLTEQPMMGIERPDLFPGTRSLAIGSHTLFYRITESSVDIIRLLHGRQDPNRHLK
jgi:toxin ParE1/3/4